MAESETETKKKAAEAGCISSGPEVEITQLYNPANFKPYPSRARRWRYVPASVRRRGTRLFDQQEWCWGQDIRRPQGNALLEYGFEYCRKPGGKRGNSFYAFEKFTGERIAVCGFGLFYANPRLCEQGLFLARYDFIPKLTPNLQIPPTL